MKATVLLVKIFTIFMLHGSYGSFQLPHHFLDVQTTIRNYINSSQETITIFTPKLEYAQLHYSFKKALKRNVVITIYTHTLNTPTLNYLLLYKHVNLFSCPNQKQTKLCIDNELKLMWEGAFVFNHLKSTHTTVDFELSTCPKRPNNCTKIL